MKDKIKKIVGRLESNTGFITLDKTESELVIKALTEYLKLK